MRCIKLTQRKGDEKLRPGSLSDSRLSFVYWLKRGLGDGVNAPARAGCGAFGLRYSGI